MSSSKSAQSGGQMKQKSLMGWFAKAGQQAPSTGTGIGTKKPGPSLSTSAKPTVVVKETPKVSNSKIVPVTDEKKNSSKYLAPSSSMASLKSASSNSNPRSYDTPPTSDAVDVDMLSDGEKAVAAKGKRKMVIDDSDSDVKPQKKPVPISSETNNSLDINSRTKKARVSYIFSDDEDEEEEDTAAKNARSRLSRFKQPAPSIRSKKSNDSMDSDFMPPDDSDVEVPLTSSRGGSSVSGSRSSDHDLESASEMSDAPKKKSTATKKKAAQSHSQSASRPTLAKSQTGDTSGTRSGGSNAFLTAAERRAKEKKEEKTSTESPFEFLKDVKDKDGNRPGEPGYDPRTLFIPKSAWSSFTPFEKQFWEIKQNHYDTVLFFQKGKFFELYEDDARIGHQQFDLKLTDRVKMAMVGVPEMSFGFWAAKFLAKGYKVGRVDQAETALGAEMRLAEDKQKSSKKSGDKIVRRELNKVYTNGTLVDPGLLVDEEAGHCVSIRELDPDSDKGTFGVCVLDTSTSEFNMSSFDDDPCRTKLETLMRQLRPKELVFTKGNLSVATTRLLKCILPGSCLWTGLREVEGFSYHQTLDELKKLYPDNEDDMQEDLGSGIGIGVPEAIRQMLTCEPAVEALGALIWYLRQLNIDKDILSMKNFNIYDPMKKGLGLVLDGQTLAHIEVLQNSEGTEEGTLLRILNRSITPFGKRLFRLWLCMPLQEVSAINARLDAVQDLINHPTFREDFAKLVKGMPDLERIVSRIHAKSCKVKDFLQVLNSFRKLSRGFDTLAELADTFDSKQVAGLLRSAPDLRPNIKHVEEFFVKPEERTDELLPQEGKDEAYDAIAEEIDELEAKLEKQLKKLENEVGCKLSYWHSAVGTKDIYLVQTKPGQKGIPNNWTKQGGTKAAARWHVPTLQQNIRSLKEARERRNMATKDFKQRVFAEFDRDRDVWLRAVRTVAELDCLLSLAKSSEALGEPMCRPTFVESDGSASIDFEELRHPAMCLRAENFIPNDVRLGGGVERVALLTGPNMGGKSTVMRMTAVGVIMAQLGMLVPAKSARIAPVDAILTRMGAYDNMFSSSSTFKVELDECCKILREATPRSLVILDELGRGTSTYDGMAIAGAVLHQLATHTLPLCFFATHYGSLTDDYAYHPNIRNMHMSTLVDDEKCELVFLYKLVSGVASSSFGTHVASLAGVPQSVVARAAQVSADFAAQFTARLEGRRGSKMLPLPAQADAAFLLSVAASASALGAGKEGEGKDVLPQNAFARREVLRLLRLAVGRYRTAMAAAPAAASPVDVGVGGTKEVEMQA